MRESPLESGAHLLLLLAAFLAGSAIFLVVRQSIVPEGFGATGITERGHWMTTGPCRFPPRGAASAPAATMTPTRLCRRAGLTAVFVLATFSLAYSSDKTGRAEQAWASWAMLVLLTLKILLQDFRQSQNLGLVISVLLYGGSLVLLPRMVQKAARAYGAKERSAV